MNATHRLTERNGDDELVRIVRDNMSFDDARQAESTETPGVGNHLRLERLSDDGWEYL